jgi:hypothetical protein
LDTDRKQADLALKVLEKLGKYELLLLKREGKPSEDSERHERLVAEYYVLRTALVDVPLIYCCCRC